MSKTEEWYVIKLTNGQCTVLSASQLQISNVDNSPTEPAEKWGPFNSQAEAIARRVGLIRAGKCEPA
ncbi:hypothetical protein OsccyDRAFT_2980 [Leptolyngbyaceae cyanobacterium JSC-12]|nr:hypothetical protein OsccyDRAFT_2980 [Leptolyngbyaceae cyanobacterium JSC-12]